MLTPRLQVAALRVQPAGKLLLEEENDEWCDDEEYDDDAGKRHFVVEQGKQRRIEKH